MRCLYREHFDMFVKYRQKVRRQFAMFLDFAEIGNILLEEWKIFIPILMPFNFIFCVQAPALLSPLISLINSLKL